MHLQRKERQAATRKNFEIDNYAKVSAFLFYQHSSVLGWIGFISFMKTSQPITVHYRQGRQLGFLVEKQQYYK